MLTFNRKIQFEKVKQIKNFLFDVPICSPSTKCLSRGRNFTQSLHKSSRMLSCYQFPTSILSRYNNDIKNKEFKIQSRYYSTQDEQSQKVSSKYILFGVVAVSVFVAAKVYQRKFNRVKEPTNTVIVHRDKLVDKTGHLIWHEGTWLPEYLFPSLKQIQAVKDFCLAEDDVLVVSFPKSGTTWVQEIIRQIYQVQNMDARKTETMEERFPYIEYVYPGLKDLAKMQHPRWIKSHLPYHLLPQDVQKGKGKVIYIARNAKDVCVSYYHFVKMMSFLNYKGQFLDFYENFVNGTVAYGPWSDHVSLFWQHRHDENVLFITYEELHKNPAGVVKQIASFLGQTLDEGKLSEIVTATNFKNMKKNPLANYSWWDDFGLRKKNEAEFMRKGQVGDWKNYFTTEMSNEIEKICMEQPIQEVFKSSS